MSAGQAVLMVGVSLVIIAVTIAVMLRHNQSERRRMERRREEWIAGGCIPEEEPNFFQAAPGQVDHPPADELPERAPPSVISPRR